MDISRDFFFYRSLILFPSLSQQKAAKKKIGYHLRHIFLPVRPTISSSVHPSFCPLITT
jgi:hypothetical protein